MTDRPFEVTGDAVTATAEPSVHDRCTAANAMLTGLLHLSEEHLQRRLNKAVIEKEIDSFLLSKEEIRVTVGSSKITVYR